MPKDYDAPRGDRQDFDTDSLEGLQAAENKKGPVDDTDDGDIVEPIDLPDFDYSNEEISVDVVPKKSDEFTCGVCYLVQHRNRLAYTENDGTMVYRDCA